eukprot:COSAG02_NODE_7000_length_3234_cov_1.806699_6_plen_90_part_00
MGALCWYMLRSSIINILPAMLLDSDQETDLVRAGNFMWQIRIEEDMEWIADQEHNTTEKRWHQVCYKYDYRADPVYGESTVCYIILLHQ